MQLPLRTRPPPYANASCNLRPKLRNTAWKRVSKKEKPPRDLLDRPTHDNSAQEMSTKFPAF